MVGRHKLFAIIPRAVSGHTPMDLAASWADARVFNIVKAKWDSLPAPKDKKDDKKGGKKGGGAKRPGSSSPAKVAHSWHFCSTFSPFAAVSLCNVVGLAETFPSFPVSGPYHLDVPGFQVPSDSVFPGFQVPSDTVFPPQLRSSSRALPLHLHFHNCSHVFSFISSSNIPEPVLL